MAEAARLEASVYEVTLGCLRRARPRGASSRGGAALPRHAPEVACRREEVARRGANPLWAGLKPSLGPRVSRRRRTRTTSRAEDCGNPASAGRRCPRQAQCKLLFAGTLGMRKFRHRPVALKLKVSRPRSKS